MNRMVETKILDKQSIPVLDKGYVRLVDVMGNDLSIVRSARVSHNADWRTGEDEGKDEKLIKFLWDNKHMTPFESVTMTFEVKAPIFVLRQWHRHRTWSYNEVSARYTEVPDEYYIPDPAHIGRQDTKNKQGRVISGLESADEENNVRRYDETCQKIFMFYHELMRAGWPRELARGVLPLASYSRMFATANLRNVLAFLDLRNDSHAQYEIRQYALAIETFLKSIAPVAMEHIANSKLIERLK